MCGIAGVWSYRRGTSVSREVLSRMCERIHHRGPDGQGISTLNEMGFAHARLSIIDLEGGTQPLSDSSQRIWVTFNGEIYNFKELRKEFEEDGVVFKTHHSDTEVIPYCYLKYGDEFASRLEGMFAIALWDTQEKRLILTRDRMGKKPLLFFKNSETLAFASEMQALVAHPEFKKELSADGVDSFLSLGYVPQNTSIFRSVRKLSPAQTLIINSDGSERSVNYWSIDPSRKSTADFDQSKQQLDSLLRDCVEKRLVADVPVGAFLSGGTDSSLVCAIASQLSERKLQTFCIGFDEKQFDERADASAVAKVLGTDHHEDVVRFDALDSLEMLQRHFGEPFADASAIPTYYLCKQLKRDVTVAISGDGGDELFLGYSRYKRLSTRYKVHKYLALLPMKDMLANRSRELLSRRQSRVGRMLSFAEDAALPGFEQYTVSSVAFRHRERSALYQGGLMQGYQNNPVLTYIEKLFEQYQDLPFEEQVGLVDRKLYMVDDILAKVDIASMASGLEVRAPLLDHKVAEFSAALPLNSKMSADGGKLLLKALLADYIPKSLVDKPKKGFGVPVCEWLKTDMKGLANDVLLSPSGFFANNFDQTKIKALLDTHQSGKLENTEKLWSLLCLGIWAEQYGLNH